MASISSVRKAEITPENVTNTGKFSFASGSPIIQLQFAASHAEDHANFGRQYQSELFRIPNIQNGVEQYSVISICSTKFLNLHEIKVVSKIGFRTYINDFWLWVI